MNFLLAILGTTSLGLSFIGESKNVFFEVDKTQNKIYLNEDEKINLLNLKFSNLNVGINKGDNDIRNTVFMSLLENYKDQNYQDFLMDLFFDSNKLQFITSGDNFVMPNSGEYVQYTIKVLANPNNLKYKGMTSIFVTLHLSENKYNISSLDALTRSDDINSYLNLRSEFNYFSIDASPKYSDILKALDLKMLEKGENQWIIDNNLFENHESCFSFDLSEIKTSESNFVEKFYKVTMGVKNENDFFERGNSATFYIHSILKFNSLDIDINKSFGEIIKSNWSSHSKWHDTDNNKYHNTQIDIKDYVTREEFELSGSYINAFSKKYSRISFLTNGYFKSYIDEKKYISNAIFNMTDLNGLNNDKEFIKDCGCYHESGMWGNSSSGDFYIKLKVIDNIIFYAWDVEMSVYGCGAPYQETSISAKIYKMSIS